MSSGGATSRHQAQHNSSRNNNQDQATSNNADDEDHNHRPRRPVNANANANQVRGRGSPLTLALVLSKALFLLTLILKFLLIPLRKVITILFPPGEYDDLSNVEKADRAANLFADYFHKSFLLNNNDNTTRTGSGDDGDDGDATANDYSDINPFSRTSYTTLIQTLSTQTRAYQSQPDTDAPPLVLIYLHSPLHAQSHKFLHDTFSSPPSSGAGGEEEGVLNLVQRNVQANNLKCWGGSIHTAEGAALSTVFNVNQYPFLTLIRLKKPIDANTSVWKAGASHLELQLRLEGPVLTTTTNNMAHHHHAQFRTAQAFLNHHLQNALGNHEQILTEQMVRRQARLEEVRLREEQDAEYQQALLEDQRRERERAEEAERVRLEEERIEEEVRRVEKERLDRLENARSLLTPEPEKGGGGGGGGEVKIARVRIMLPTGQRLERRFRGEDTIAVVRAFLILYFDEKSIQMENFELRSNYPKKALTDGDKTLEEEGLCPQAVIMVQDLDA